MSLSTSGRTWEEASSPVAVRVTRQFETAWRESNGRRPDPDAFLPPDHRDRPGARLALLRADLGLRWEAGERVEVEWYRERYPDLDDETLVALIYEEFCLREDEQEAPDPADYRRRFPEVASRLRRVLDIHGLVGSGQTTTTHGSASSEIPFPEAGQTIAGFHLVEELGRGAFARVFLAQERQLADRPVALKVARSGSREPQTLARLQHTNIVPVHSTRTDPATGLHLLCMPYFGRVTLATLLADDAVKQACTGGELVEALDRLGIEKAPSKRSTGRAALARRSFPLAIAWWGSRMAEALEHAHERGVLHRDVKPSNVLVTGDGIPMLLDFNLARETVTDDPESPAATLGGTLDYMAPEHLEGLADDLAHHVDARSDIYGLGVLLYESLAGTRPFTTPKGARSATELLLLAAEERRMVAPAIRASNREVPAALEAIVRRCLAPEPNDRYATAGELAADLQAVADDRPLRFTREPIPSRLVRWTRRNRRMLAMAAPVLLASGIMAATFNKFQHDRENRSFDVKHLIEAGEESARKEDFRTAATQLETAAQLANGHPYLISLFKDARVKLALAKETGAARDHADTLFHEAEPLRFRLTLFLGDLDHGYHLLNRTLAPFFVLVNQKWLTLPEQTLLDETRSVRLHREINEVLFLWAAAVARDPARDPKTLRRAIQICNDVLSQSSASKNLWKGLRPGPWQTLRGLLTARLGEPVLAEDRSAGPAAEESPLACFQWGYLRELQGHHRQALDWFRRAALHEQNNYWYHYYLAYFAGLSGSSDEALRHYAVAVALAPESPWAHFGLGQFYREQGTLPTARAHLEKARGYFEALHRQRGETEEGLEFRLTRLALGYVRQRQGDRAGARREYDRLIAKNPNDEPGRAARLNRAALDAADGAVETARAEYESLVASNRNDFPARQGRALLALQAGEARSAEVDFDELVRRTQGRNDQFLADRARARLLLGRGAPAEADARTAYQLNPSPGHLRLWARTLLAQGRVEELPIDRPEELAQLPMGGAPLRADLRRSATRLGAEADGSGAGALRARLNRALLLAALRDPAAEVEAERARASAPYSPQVDLVRGQVQLRLGRPRAAESDADLGLHLDPDDPRLLELRGRARLAAGNPREALTDLDRAISLGGANTAIRSARAEAFLAVGDATRALQEWGQVLSLDPEAPYAYLGRARTYLQLKKSNLAMTDLEQAAAWAGDQPELALALLLTAARCLPEQPGHLPRTLALTRRLLTSRPVPWPLPTD